MLKPAIYKTNIMICVKTSSLQNQHYGSVKTGSLQNQHYDMCSNRLFTKPTLWYVLKPALKKPILLYVFKSALYKTNIMICVQTISLQYQQYDMCSNRLFTKATLWYVLKPALKKPILLYVVKSAFYKTNIMICVQTGSLQNQHYDMC